jgi:hypothetical protein
VDALLKGLDILGVDVGVRVLSDRPSYLENVRNIIKYVKYTDHKRLSSMRFLAFNHAPRLDVHDCLELLHYTIRQTGGTSVFLGLPAIVNMTPEQLFALMQLCMQDWQDPSPDRFQDDDYHDGRCSSCGHKPEPGPTSCQRTASQLALLPAAAGLSVQQLASIITLCIGRVEGPNTKVMLALLALPVARDIGTSTAEGLLAEAFKHGAEDAFIVLCEQFGASAVAWIRNLDPQLLSQHMYALMCRATSSYSKQRALRAFLGHPSLQWQAQHILPQLLVSAFAQACSAEYITKPYIGDVLKVLLQLPAAQSLSACVLRELMKLSIQGLDGALLPMLVRLPAAAALQHDDVAVLLQAALGRTCAGHSSSLAPVSGRFVTSEASTAGTSSAPAWLQLQQQAGPRQWGVQQQQTGLAEDPTQQQQGQYEQVVRKSQGSHDTVTELLQECLQRRAATASMFQLLMLPWVQQLSAVVLKDLLVAAAQWQCKALFHWLLQQPQAPKGDADVQEYAGVLRFTAGSTKADPCCYVPEEPPSPVRRLQLEPDTPEASDSESYDERGKPVDKETTYDPIYALVDDWGHSQFPLHDGGYAATSPYNDPMGGCDE